MPDNDSIFANRNDAGIQLADALLALDIKADVVLALPRQNLAMLQQQMKFWASGLFSWMTA